jgi:protein ImuB
MGEASRRVSLWFPAWSADRFRRESSRRGAPPGEPLLFFGREKNRDVVTAVSAAAAGMGVRVGEALAAVRARLPDLVAEPHDEGADAAALLKLGQWACRRYSPLVALDPPDGLVLEAAGASHLWGGEARMLADIAARMAREEIMVRLAVAPTAAAARALARFGRESPAIVPPGGIPEAVSDLPVVALGMAADEAAALSRLGIATVGDLVAIPRAAAGRRFGLQLLKQLDRMMGTAAEAFDWLELPQRLAVKLLFPEPLLSAGPLEEAVRRLVRALVPKLAAAGVGARRLDLAFLRIDGSVSAVRAGLARPSRDPAHLMRLLLMLVEQVDPGFGVEAGVLSVPLAASLAPEPVGAGGGDAGFEAAVDRLSVRLGEESVWRAARSPSDLPEASVKRVPAIRQEGGRDGPGWPARLPRPVRIIEPPEPIDAIAMLPDRPPVLFVWRGRRHRVRGADGPERVTGEWWADPARASRVRDYFAVEDEAGARFWLFREGDGEDPATGDMRWRIHGVFGG